MKTAATGGRRWLLILALGLALGLAGCMPPFYGPSLPPPPPPPPTEAPPQVARPVFYVSVNRLNLRAGPGMDFPKVSTLEKNEEVEKVGQVEDWSQIRVRRDGSLGFVNSRYLSREPLPLTPEVAPAPEPAPPAVVTPPPLPERPPAMVAPPPLPERPTAAEKPKPPEGPAAIKKKAEEAKPAKPAKPSEAVETPRPKPAPGAEKPAPPAAKPAPPAEKPAPPPEPAEPPGRIRIM